MIFKASILILCLATSIAADPFIRRKVDQLDQAAFKESHQRDDTATRAFSNIELKTSNGKCLFVDELSGDFRANLNPVQIAECGTTAGQTWDIITSGKHNNQGGQVLIVNTLTQACLNFDPRRPAGNQVIMFSCGGRADGSGAVTDSQLFAFNGAASLALVPKNGDGACLTVRGEAVDVVKCDRSAEEQVFTLSGDAGPRSSLAAQGSTSLKATRLASQAATTAVSSKTRLKTKCSGRRRRTVTVTNFHTVTASIPGVVNPVITVASDSSSVLKTTGRTTTKGTAKTTKGTLESNTSVVIAQTSSKRVTKATNAADVTTAPSGTTAAPSRAAVSSGTVAPSEILTINPTTPVPVSRAGGTLNPSAAAEANDFDDTAVRVLESVNIRAPDGRCLFIDPTAGDFRQNLIPVQLVKCSEEPNQKFDVVTKGKHNDGKAGKSLLVSVLMDGCLSFDGRRPEGDTVTIFSCGGRAAGDGGTDSAQLYSFDGSNNIVLAPASGRNETCLVARQERLVSGACANDGSQTFELVEVL